MSAHATIRETRLYVANLPRAVAYHRSLLNYKVLAARNRFCALDAGSDQMLLLFRKGTSTSPGPLLGGTIPPRDGRGPATVGFGTELAEKDDWNSRLTQPNIPVERRMSWPHGDQGVFLCDPDGQLAGLLPRGTGKAG